MLDQLGQALAAEDAAAMVATMAEDVTLHVAVHDTLFEGVQAATQIFGLVLGGVLHEVEVVDTIRGGGTAEVLMFSARVADYPSRADGLLVVRPDADGRIGDLTVFLRPLAALQALADEMGRRTGGPPAAMTEIRERRRRGTGHELRDVVVRAATKLLAELGNVDALTMRAVATASGVTPPSVYRHFPDKETLVREVIAERFDEFTSLLQTAAASAGSEPSARLEAICRAYLRFGAQHPGHYQVLFSATNAGPVGLGLQPGTEHPGAVSYRLLVDAVGACLPAPRRDAALALATELWASLHGIVDLRITKPELPWPDAEVLLGAALAAVRST